MFVPSTPHRVTPSSKLRHLVQPVRVTLFPEANAEARAAVDMFFSSSPLIQRRHSERAHISPLYRRKWDEDLCSPLRESRKQPKIVFLQESQPILKLENFVFRGELGRGSFAVVQKVVSPDLHTYALKQIERHCSSVRAAMHMLEREYHWHTMLADCPHIVRSQGLSLDENNCFMLLEYCEGGSLDGDLTRRRTEDCPMTEMEARRLATHMLNALISMHNRGVVHGDIKPANIMLKNEDGVLAYKLGDFGNALRTDAARIEFDPGDQRYYARELLAGVSQGVKDPTKADVFSLGLTLWEAFTLKHAPHNSDPAWNTLREGHVSSAPTLSDGLNDIVKAMLHPSSDLRLSAADALALIQGLPQ